MIPEQQKSTAKLLVSFLLVMYPLYLVSDLTIKLQPCKVVMLNTITSIRVFLGVSIYITL